MNYKTKPLVLSKSFRSSSLHTRPPFSWFRSRANYAGCGPPLALISKLLVVRRTVWILSENSSGRIKCQMQVTSVEAGKTDCDKWEAMSTLLQIFLAVLMPQNCRCYNVTVEFSKTTTLILLHFRIQQRGKFRFFCIINTSEIYLFKKSNTRNFRDSCKIFCDNLLNFHISYEIQLRNTSM